jgi:hypothetical protein
MVLYAQKVRTAKAARHGDRRGPRPDAQAGGRIAEQIHFRIAAAREDIRDAAISRGRRVAHVRCFC